MIFGTSIPTATGHQIAIQFPTSPNICFYTTWGKRNKRNMHWNEQQTSTNWRQDRIKNLIMVVWANEVHRLLTYCSTSCYQTCRWWHVRVSAGQCTSASARKTIELLERKPPEFISPDLWPQIALISIWSITSTMGDHATAGLSDNVQEYGWTQEATGYEIWIGLEQNIIDTAINAWRNHLRACVRAKSRHIEHWL